MKLGSLNNEIRLEVLNFPKINVLEYRIMLIHKYGLYLMNTWGFFFFEHLGFMQCKIALNAWERIKEVRKRTGLFLKLYRSQKNSSMFLFLFLQRFPSVVNRVIQNLEATQIIIESMTFQNANSQ